MERTEVNNSGFNLKDLQKKQVEILMLIQELCNRNNINFSIYAGTALGAVRHKGFIPWDDDVDIAMSRNDYIRFKEVCKTQLPEKYTFQDYHSEPDFPMCFGKIRDNNTTFIEEEIQHLDINKGVFVDIFPFDVVPSNKFLRLTQFMFASLNLLFARGYPSKKDGKVMYSISKIILSVIPKNTQHKFRGFCEKQISRYKNENYDNVAFLIDRFGNLRKYFPYDLLNSYTVLEFENINVPIFRDYQKYLTIQYGDYMKLPPEEERVNKHLPLICDLKNSYKKYSL